MMRASEVGGRGLEGLAVKHQKDKSTKVAVLWEGGYPEDDKLPPQLAKKLSGKSLNPFFFVHTIKKDKTVGELKGAKLVELKVPQPPKYKEPKAQRFRTPALVWHKWGKTEGFIVLLSSSNALKKDFLYKRLQRFDLKGNPIPGTIDVLAKAGKELKKANWEGMAWFEPGESLILIHDTKKETQALIIKIPKSWK